MEKKSNLNLEKKSCKELSLWLLVAEEFDNDFVHDFVTFKEVNQHQRKNFHDCCGLTGQAFPNPGS